MKIEIKCSELMRLRGQLAQALATKEKWDIKFTYALARNEKFIMDAASIAEKEMRDLSLTKEQTDRAQEYAKQKQIMVDKWAEKDGSGNKKVMGNQYVLTDTAAFDMELKALDAKYKDILDENNKLLEERKKINEQFMDIEAFSMPLEYFPEDILPETMKTLLPFIPKSDNLDDFFGKKGTLEEMPKQEQK